MAKRREGWCGCQSVNSTLSCKMCCYKWMIVCSSSSEQATVAWLHIMLLDQGAGSDCIDWNSKSRPPPKPYCSFFFCEWCSVMRLILSFLCGVSIGVATLRSPLKTTRAAFLALKPFWKCAAEKLQTSLCRYFRVVLIGAYKLWNSLLVPVENFRALIWRARKGKP